MIVKFFRNLLFFFLRGSDGRTRILLFSSVSYCSKDVSYASLEYNCFNKMDLRKSSETRPRARGESVDAAFTCGFLNSSESLEMQNSSTAEGSVTEITKAKRRSQNKPWAIGYARKNSMPAERKALSSKPSFEAERRISQPVKHSAGNKHEKKVKFWQENSKINVPKRWFIEYDRRQVS